MKEIMIPFKYKKEINMKNKKELLDTVLCIIESHINNKKTIQNLIETLDLNLNNQCLATILLNVSNADFQAREVKQKIKDNLEVIINNICENGENNDFLTCCHSKILKKYILNELYTSFAVQGKLSRSNDAFINTCLDNHIDPEIDHLYALNLLSHYEEKHRYLKKYINDWLKKYVDKEIKPLLTKEIKSDQRSRWVKFIDDNTSYVCNPDFPHNFDYDLLCKYLLTNYPEKYYRVFIKTARIIEKHLYAPSNEVEIKHYKMGFEHLIPVWFCEKKYDYDITIYLDDNENIFEMTFEEYSKLLDQAKSKGIDALVLKSRSSSGLNKRQENIIKKINDDWYSTVRSFYASIADYYINNFNVEDEILEYVKIMSNGLENIDNRNSYKGVINIFKGSNKLENHLNNITTYNSGKTKYAIKSLKKYKVIYVKYDDEDSLNKVVLRLNSFNRHPLVLYKFNILYIILRENEYYIIDDMIKN